MTDAIKLFTHKVDEFIEINKSEIIKEVNLKELNCLLENDAEFINQLLNQFSVKTVNVEFDKIEYSEEPEIVYDLNRNPINRVIYTFKVPFEGDVNLLKYCSKKGKFKANTYFAKDNFICFNSLNFDIEPVSKKFNNTIDVLESIILNINKDYEDWNKYVEDFIEKTVKIRKNILIDFKNFCDNFKISLEEFGEMEFKLGALEALSKIIADTRSGSEITTLFKKAGFPEIVHDGSTKWRFVCATFEEMQNESIEGFYKILKVLEVVCDPQEYFSNLELHVEVLEKINMVLSFYGLKFNEEGKLLCLDSINKTLKTSAPKIKQDENDYYDVFISYSSKDKDWVNQLYNTLCEKGLVVWYDEIMLLIGDDLHKRINDGLNKSDFAVVVLSENYIKSFWPYKEYVSSYQLMADERFLPIIHGLSRDELDEFDKSLSNTIYMDTGKHSVDEIAEKIYIKIKRKTSNTYS